MSGHYQINFHTHAESYLKYVELNKHRNTHKTQKYTSMLLQSDYSASKTLLNKTINSHGVQATNLLPNGI